VSAEALAGEPGEEPVPRRPGLGGRFWRLCGADTVSALGDGVSFAAFPLLATTITTDPRLVALVNVGEYLPLALFGLLTGVLADRLDRRRTMWTLDMVRMAVLAGFAAIVVTAGGSVLLLVVTAFVLTSTGILHDNCGSALLPATVPDKRQLERANSWLQGNYTVAATLLGPPLGSVLFATRHSAPFLLDAASFLAAGLLVASLRGVQGRPERTAARQPIRRDLVEGLRWLWGHRLLRTLCLLLAVLNMCFAAMLAVLVLYAKGVLGLTATGYGLLVATFAVGSLAGAVAAAPAQRRLGTGPVIAVGMATMITGLLLLGVTSAVPAAVAGLVVGGFGSTLWNIVAISLRQRVVPDELLGRVTSAYRTVGMGTMPIGAGVGGVVARAWGLHAPFWLGAVVFGTAAVLGLPTIIRVRAD
jgi:MFS family permease